METRLKSLKFKKQTATLTVEPVYNQNWYTKDREKLIALTLLLGMYNPLRPHTDNDQPIDLGKLRKYQQQFADLIWNIRQDMTINVTEIDELK